MDDVYKSFAEAYKNVVKNNKDLDKMTKQDFKRKEQIYNFLSKLTEEDICEIFVAGAFHEIVEGYTIQAADRIKLPDDNKKRLYTAMKSVIRGEEPQSAIFSKNYYERELSYMYDFD